MKFIDIKFEKMAEHFGPRAISALVSLDNGFELSIVRHNFSYGGDKGLYEVGVFLNNGMATPEGWDDEVKGWLDKDGVEQTIDELSRQDTSTAQVRSLAVQREIEEFIDKELS